MGIHLHRLIFIILLVFTKACLSQNSITKGEIGGGCDGCELMYIGMPNNISATSYSPAFNSAGQKLLITGKTLKTDGTPVADVMVYYWQTDNTGYYTSKDYLDNAVKRHGHVRGWVKSDSQGNYAIYSIKPKAYPNRDIPAHIHLSIKEPDINNEYYVDNLVFNYDPLLTTAKRKKHKNRGGSGVLRAMRKDDMVIAEHNIILGLNIPNYPETGINQQQSGQELGEDFHSITPFHAWGQDIGKTTCPVCRYGRYFGIMYFVNDITTLEVKEWLTFLEQLSDEYGDELKVYLIYASHEKHNFTERTNQLAQLGKQLNLKKIALTHVPSFDDKTSDIYLSRINADVKNTIIIYRNRNIISKSVDLSAKHEDFGKIKQILETNNSHYFQLPIDKEN